MAGKSEEEVYKYLNGEVFICRNRDVFTTDDMQLGTVESQIIFYFICHFWYKFLLFLAKYVEYGTVASLIIFYFICHFWYKFYLFLA